MNAACRNIGRPGIAASAISAIDVALWDLKARHLDLPLASLLGCARKTVPVYGSGGFTSYDVARLTSQLAGWAEQGCRWVKMKIGRHPGDDRGRVQAAAKAIADAILFVDANGAYDRKQALGLTQHFGALGVGWFEEPVSSDDLEGLRLLRDRAPGGMAIAAGEYGYSPWVLPRHADRWRRGCSAGRCHALRRHHGLSARGSPVRRLPDTAVQPLCPGPACGGGRCRAASCAHGMVS
jgi:L-alanine-DL-glutamate epimerase-like enolase superfamily enzyme